MMLWRGLNRRSGCDNHVLLQVSLEQEVVIAQLVSYWGDNGDEGAWDLPWVKSLVPDLARNEQQVLFRRVSELGPGMKMTVRRDMTNLLMSSEDVFRTKAIRDRLELKAVDKCSKIGEQMESITGSRSTTDELGCEKGNVCLRVQEQTGKIGLLERGAETEVASSAALAEVKPLALC